MPFSPSLKKEFSTMTIVLMAVAIVINMAVGQLVSLLKLPVFLDSIGTVLVGILAGPWAGGLTGLMTNLIWGMAASLLFVFTTHPADLIAAVTRAAGSPSLAYLVGSPLLLLPSMRRRVAVIQSAQQARGMNIRGSVFGRIRCMVPLVLPLVHGALSEIEQRSIALELKGFTSPHPRTSLRRVPDSMLQKRARQGMLVLTVGGIVYGITGV